MTTLLVSGRNINCKLQNALYIPDLSYNYLSVGAVNTYGHIVVSDGKLVELKG